MADPDLRKAAQLASELLGELENQGQGEGDLVEHLSRFIHEADEIAEAQDAC